MRTLKWHLIQQELCIRTSSIYVVSSVFIAIIKFTAVKLSEIMKCFIKYLTVVVMTNLIYFQNSFREKAIKNEKILLSLLLEGYVI